MAKEKPDSTTTRQLKERWGGPLIDAGYTVIPNAILLRMQALGLDALDLAIIAHIASYWWSKEKLPFPSKASLAKGLRVDPSTIRRRIAKLEAGKLIRRVKRKGRHGGNDSNMYDLAPLIKAAEPYAKEMIQERNKSIKDKQERLARRGRPKLTAVK